MCRPVNPNRPRFSIVMPAYNGEQTITDTIQTCLDQSFADFEIVVVNDGSTDQTADVLASIQDDRLCVLQQKNAGPAAARNRGMEASKGEFIAFLDADDRWGSRYLENVNDIIKSREPCLLYGRIVVDRGVGRYWIKPTRALQHNEAIHDYLYVHGGFIQTSTIVIPASLAQQVSWDETVTFGDNDQFAIDCWNAGLPFHMIEEAQTLYNDVPSDTALSQLPIHGGSTERYTNFFAWMRKQKPQMSNRAWLAFQARFESVALARQHPLKSLSLLWNAWRGNAMSATSVLRQIMQNLTPRLYRRLIDLYVRFNGQQLPEL